MADRDNRGATALRKVPGLTQADFIRALKEDGLDVDSAMVSRWWRGERRPDPRFRAAIERRYGIGWQLWDEEMADAVPPESKEDTGPEPANARPKATGDAA
jgi:transcriptional regulator with XRE-family HTH domain